MVRPREFNDEDVLAKAMLLFRTKGFQRTTMADVARETGMQRGSLYNAYCNKETLFLKGFELYSDKFLLDIKAALAKGTLKKRLDNFFSVAISNMRKGKPSQGCLTTRVIIELADENEVAKVALQNFLTHLHEIIEGVLEIFRAQEKFSGDPFLCAQMLVATTRGMAVIDRAYDDEQRLNQIASEIVRLILKEG